MLKSSIHKTRKRSGPPRLPVCGKRRSPATITQLEQIMCIPQMWRTSKALNIDLVTVCCTTGSAAISERDSVATERVAGLRMDDLVGGKVFVLARRDRRLRGGTEPRIRDSVRAPPVHLHSPIRPATARGSCRRPGREWGGSRFQRYAVFRPSR
ncbi:hypothetical protein VTK56DRAFT_2893 [Thermocarpiscus australiensis]